jgi:hypothetical protein
MAAPVLSLGLCGLMLTSRPDVGGWMDENLAATAQRTDAAPPRLC